MQRGIQTLHPALKRLHTRILLLHVYQLNIHCMAIRILKQDETESHYHGYHKTLGLEQRQLVGVVRERADIMTPDYRTR